MYEITFQIENKTVVTKQCGDRLTFYTILSVLIIPAFKEHILWMQGWKLESNEWTIIYEYDKKTNVCELYKDD